MLSRLLGEQHAAHPPPEARRHPRRRLPHLAGPRAAGAGGRAIWIYAPLTAKKCPECGDSPGWHEQAKTDCKYHEESEPEAWSTGVVGFKPVPVFDISQTEGEPLPDLDTAATDDGTEFRAAVEDACEDLPVEYEAVP